MNDSVPLCPLCNARLSTPWISGIDKGRKEYSVFICNHCMVGCTFPFPSGEERSDFYASGSYRTMSGKRFHAPLELLIYLFRLLRRRRITRYVTKGRILDIGCGRGLFLHVMRKRGWVVEGVEFSKETAASATEAYGLHVVTGEPDKWGFSEGSFDVVTLSHVLEHCDRPLDIITYCRKLLRESGLLVVALPNLDSLQALTGKGVWFHLDVPFHLLHFSELGICSVLEENSFRISRIRRFDFEYNPIGWLQTLLSVSGIRENLLYNLLKSPEIRGRELAQATRKDVLLTILLLPLYCLPSLFLSLLESFVLKRGGTIEVYAVKESTDATDAL